MIIKNDLVILRAPEPHDVDFLFLLENNPDVAECSSATAPLSRQQMWTYIQNYSADIFAGGELRLVVVENGTGEAVGAVDITGFSARHRHAEVGIAIDEDARGRGLGKAALSLLCDYAHHTLGMHSLSALVAEDNKPSRALFAACGFAGCGRLRSWVRRGASYVDAQIYQRLFS